MLRVRSLIMILMTLLATAGSSCHSTDHSTGSSDQGQPGEKTYHLKCGPMVPVDLAREIESKACREGRNELAVFPTGRFYAVITNGTLDSLILEVKGEPPTVVARMPDPAPNPDPPVETPMGCDQRLEFCKQQCASAADRQCCECRCFVQWVQCTRSAGVGGPGMWGGISMR